MDAIISVDDGQHIVLFNAAAERMFGYSAAEVIGRPISLIIPDRFRASHESHIRRFSVTGETSRAMGALGAISGLRRCGEEFPIEASISQLESGGQKIFTVILRDITERKRAERQLQHLTEELEVRVKERTEELTRSQQRLRALAAEVTLTEQKERRRIATELHDYLAQLLVVGRLKLSQGQKRLHAASRQDWLKELDGLLEQSLTYTRSLVAQLSPPVLHEFGLVVALRWLADQMRQHGLAVTVEAGREELDLPEDQAVLLYQSVRELLFNVVKHAGVDRATVSLHVSPEKELHIAVADRGRGGDFTESATAETMPPRFGLFSIRERMTVMGGTLVIDSSPEQGTCVTLVIRYQAAGTKFKDQSVQATGPRVSSASQAGNHLEAASLEPLRTGVIRVLLVDDHAMVRQGLRSILEGYEDIHVAGEAGNGVEAMELAHSLSPDVIVMDVNMPRMDGIDATRAIKQAKPGPLIIGLSVRNDRETEQAMRAAGATGFLTKESAAEQLYEAIRVAIINAVTH
jgi:PAS domain S-box-containing protein